MCQLPLMSMWVSRTRSPEKRMSSHLPTDSTWSTVRPASGESTSMRESLGRTVSKRVTTCPSSARRKVRAVRHRVSPSGIGARLEWPADLEAERAVDEAGLFEEAGEEVVAGGGVVDLADEHSAAAALPAVRDVSQAARQFARDVAAVGLVFGQQYGDRGVLTAQERGKLAVDQDHAGAGGARHGADSGPGQHSAV